MVTLSTEGNLKARKFIDDKRETKAKQFQQNISLKLADVYRKKLNDVSSEAFVAGNRSDIGVTKSVLQNIFSNVHRKCNSAVNLNPDILELQEKYIKNDKELDVNKNQKLYGYIHFSSISHSGIHISLFDEGLVRFYHRVAPYEILFFDATGFSESPITWLKNENGKPKRILLYALTIRHPSGKVPPIALMEHNTSEHNIFSIRQAFLRFRECK